MLTRNSVVWIIGMTAGALAYLSGHFHVAHTILGIPEAWQPWIELAGAAVGGASAILRQSPLPHSASSDQTIAFSRVVSDPPAPIVRSANR